MNGDYCSLGLFGGEPSKEDCLGCDSYDGMSRGLGDDIAKITKTLKLDEYGPRISKKFGLDCGCKERQKKWNEMFPHESED
jgi:hypothetical protein